VDQYTFIPGFAELNNTMDLGWQQNAYYKQLIKNIERLNTYKQMQQYAWGADPIRFTSFPPQDLEMYKEWLQYGIDLQTMSDFDEYYEKYLDIVTNFGKR